MDGRQYFVLVGKDERLRDRNKLLRGNDQLNVQIHSQLFPISLFLCTFLCNHGLFMFRRKIQLRTYFLYCGVFIIFINSDVEQQNYYLKRGATQRYLASAFSDKGGPVQKKEKITISTKSHLEVFCINRTSIGCYDFVRIEIQISVLKARLYKRRTKVNNIDNN